MSRPFKIGDTAVANSNFFHIKEGDEYTITELLPDNQVKVDGVIHAFHENRLEPIKVVDPSEQEEISIYIYRNSKTGQIWSTLAGAGQKETGDSILIHTEIVKV